MDRIRKYQAFIALLGIAVFSTPIAASYCGYAVDQVFVIFLVDFEDTSESTEDISTENKLKEYHLNNSDRIMLNKKHVNNIIEFGQLDFDHSLEVFLEVVTPPPEV